MSVIRCTVLSFCSLLRYTLLKTREGMKERRRNGVSGTQEGSDAPEDEEPLLPSPVAHGHQDLPLLALAVLGVLPEGHEGSLSHTVVVPLEGGLQLQDRGA